MVFTSDAPKPTLRVQTDVHSLPEPEKDEAYYYDDGAPKMRAPGLALRVRKGGSRKFVFFYRFGGRQLKYTIGDASAWTLDKVRLKARSLRVKVDSGENPADEKASRADAALLFSAVMRDYLEARKPEMKPRSYAECARHLEKLWKPLHRMTLSTIDRATIAARLNIIGKESGAVSANRARSTLSTIFTWAIGEGLCETNPVTGTNKKGEGGPRKRVLSDTELVAVWNAAPDNDFGSIVKLLMLTAQRRDEIGELQWPEVDIAAKVISLPGSRTKNSEAHDVPLSSTALALLEATPKREGLSQVFGNGQFGFSGWSRSKTTLDRAAGLTDWTLHDLRRTAATRMGDLGILPHVIEAILNHVSGHKKGVAGIYNRSTYAKEKVAALELWASHLKVEIAKASGANVHTLRA